MPIKLEPILLVAEPHIPYHDKRAWKLMLSVAKDLRPKHIIAIGDFMDFYAVSDHSKDPKRALRLREEVDEGCTALDQLDELGASDKRYIGGNHEDRLQRYLQSKAPELFDFVDVEKILNLKGRGWKYIPYKDSTKLGKVYFTHDVGSSGRNATFKALDTYHHSVVTGHCHRMQYIVEGNATGDMMLSAQFGWLGDAKKIDYMHKVKVLKDWALGFGIGYLDPRTGYCYMQPVPLVKYTCVVNGRLYA